jgi:hypothetical protein
VAVLLVLALVADPGLWGRLAGGGRAGAGVAWAAEAAEEGSSAGEAEAEAQLAAGRKLYDKQEYTAALEAYRLALSSGGGQGATRRQRVQANAFIGAIAAVLGDAKQAREAFRELLRLEPSYQLADPSFSPKILNLFADVQRKTARPPLAGLKAQAPLIAEGQWVELKVAAANASVVRKVVVHVRRRGEARYRRLIMTREANEDVWSARVNQTSGDLDYYAEADGADRALVGQTGRPDRPLHVALGDAPVVPAGGGVAVGVGAAAGRGGPVDEPPSRPWYRRWWVWTLAVAVVGGGVAAAVILTRPGKPATPQGTLPTAQLP